MRIKHIANVEKGQDGAIWNGFLFRFDTKGKCCVYDITDMETEISAHLETIDSFFLDRVEEIRPHCNSVVFGNEYFSSEDSFPLLYANVYNNYAKAEKRLEGVCLVYRLQRKNGHFLTTLVQILEIGFTDHDLWKSCSEEARPYGNFVINRNDGTLYAFTMRDKTNTTRYFTFDLPKLSDGEKDPVYGVPKVIIPASSVLKYFDCEYHHFIQGATMHNGKIYSLEGFTNSEDRPPALRIIDAEKGQQELYVKFEDFGLCVEPEMIDFMGDTCIYGDAHGNLYKIIF